ncbi:MAG: 4-phosphoerythronate dehydrogenase, partial [Lentisphaerae bacterium]|nr:4-phosphoerythronate dehydrogenase [Lentisphaerota bacterium]
MKIICATNMPYAEEAFSRLGEVQVLAPSEITPAAVHDAEIMAIRSTTKVNRDLLEGSRVRFVGTATIGTDHMDKDYLDAAGITWCSAAGCNANSVTEYTITAILCMTQAQGRPLAGRTLG